MAANPISFPRDPWRLDEYDKDEWREFARVVRPDLTDEESDVMWAGFVAMKKAKSLNG